MAEEYLMGSDGPLRLDIKRVTIAASSSGDNTLVAAVAGKKYRVLSYDYQVNAAVNVKFKSGSTDITGLYYNGAQGDGKVNGYNPLGWFESSAANEALIMNLSGAVAVGGVLTYIELITP